MYYAERLRFLPDGVSQREIAVATNLCNRTLNSLKNGVNTPISVSKAYILASLIYPEKTSDDICNDLKVKYPNKKKEVDIVRERIKVDGSNKRTKNFFYKCEAVKNKIERRPGISFDELNSIFGSNQSLYLSHLLKNNWVEEKSGGYYTCDYMHRELILMKNRMKEKAKDLMEDRELKDLAKNVDYHLQKMIMLMGKYKSNSQN